MAAGVTLLAAACGGDDAPTTTTGAPTTTTTTTTAPASTTTIAPVPASLPAGGLRVLVVGDSVMHDAEPGIAAALAATGQASAREATAFGLGFSDGAAIPFAGAADDLLAGAPVDQVVVMVGSWDHFSARGDPEGYAAQVRAALERLAADGRRVLVLGEPPSDPTKGEEELRAMVNGVLEQQAAVVEGARYVATDTIIGDARGDYQRTVVVGGRELLLRKPDGRHLCPDGSVRFGVGVVRELQADWALPEPAPGWEDDPWRAEGRYDDPPGGCAAP